MNINREFHSQFRLFGLAIKNKKTHEMSINLESLIYQPKDEQI
jgi:hypothetical protein